MAREGPERWFRLARGSLSPWRPERGHGGPIRVEADTLRMRTTNRQLASWLIAACGVWLIGLGLYFIAVRPPLLPEDTRFMGATATQIQAALPGLDGWLKRVFTVMGGFMAGAGVLTVLVAVVVMPLQLKGTSPVLALTGALTVALMSGMNFALRSDFRWLLLIPAVTWLVGLAFHVARRSERDSEPTRKA